MLPARLSLDLPEDIAHLSMVRRIVREMSISFGITKEDRDDIELLVGELTANALRHAHSGTAYRIEIELSDDLAVIVVTDQGKGFLRDEVAAPGTLRANDRDSDVRERLGGWGLLLIEVLADMVEFRSNEPHGTRVRAEKRLHFRKYLPMPPLNSLTASYLS